MRRLSFVVAITVTSALLLSGCNRDGYDKSHEQRTVNIGNPENGARLLGQYGCGGCHAIEGVPNAVGLVGPSLNGIGKRVYIAGKLRNTPDNMEHWIRDPQSVVPGNAMPNMGVNHQEARDITAYLYASK